MIYLDSNALVKLVREEAGSESLFQWLDERSDEPLVTSALARTEVVRAVRRGNHSERGVLVDPTAMAEELDAAVEVLDAVAMVSLDSALLDRAGELEQPMLRSLDAIHIVSALWLDVVGLAFVTYDRRLGAVAGELGLDVVAPA
ncbi:MAG: type II toxin-antitoxin system VapC family toxin [Pseudonocardia sp.]|nr:type II toxin-antitoxin system VapC family toxin [Pseudonocardia sp.]